MFRNLISTKHVRRGAMVALLVGLAAFTPLLHNPYGWGDHVDSCWAKGDDFTMSTAEWTVSTSCVSPTFNGGTFTISSLYDPEGAVGAAGSDLLVYFIVKTTFKGGGAVRTLVPGAQWFGYPSGGSASFGGKLTSGADGIFFTGYPATCPSSYYNDASGCVDYALANSTYHDEPNICIDNGAVTQYSDCETIYSALWYGIEDGFVEDPSSWTWDAPRASALATRAPGVKHLLPRTGAAAAPRH